MPVAGVLPVTWKRARMFTTPGFCGDVCGVSEMRSSFLSYAGYAVSRGTAAGCGGGLWVCGNENADCATGTDDAAAGGGGDAAEGAGADGV